MSHMVIYRGADGKPGYQQAEDIHDAVTFVEQMRNEDGVEHARIFRLEEVEFEYRPYFRVELASSMPGGEVLAAPPPMAAVPSGPTVDVTDEALGVMDDPAFEMMEPGMVGMDGDELGDVTDMSDAGAVAGNGAARRGLFGR